MLMKPKQKIFDIFQDYSVPSKIINDDKPALEITQVEVARSFTENGSIGNR